MMLEFPEKAVRAAAIALGGWLPFVPVALGAVGFLAAFARSALGRPSAKNSGRFALFCLALEAICLAGETAEGARPRACALYGLSVAALFAALYFAASVADLFFENGRKRKKARAARMAIRTFSEGERRAIPREEIPFGGRRNAERESAAPRVREERSAPIGERPAAAGAPIFAENLPLPSFRGTGRSGGAASDGYASPADFAPPPAPSPLTETERPAVLPSPSAETERPAEPQASAREEGTGKKAAPPDPPRDNAGKNGEDRAAENPLLDSSRLPSGGGKAEEEDLRALGREHAAEIVGRLRAQKLSAEDEREVRAAEKILLAESEEAGSRELNRALAGLVSLIAKYKV